MWRSQVSSKCSPKCCPLATMNNSNHANDQYQSPATQLAHLQAQLALCQTQARVLDVQRAMVQTNMVALQGQAHAFDLQMNEVQTKMADIAAVVQKEHDRKARKALTDKSYRERQAAQAAEKKRRAEEEPACEASGTEQNPRKHKQSRRDFVRAMAAIDKRDKMDRIGVALPLTQHTGASGLDSGWAPSTGHDLPFV